MTEASILDFECSYHMTPNREWFAPYRLGNFGSVYIGNDKVCFVVGMRQVKISLDDMVE